MNEVSWNFADLSTTSQTIPAWAIVCAIIFFIFCLVGLLFLLAKETTVQGTVQVIVQGQNLNYTATIPVRSLAQITDINARVGYARSLATNFGQPAQPGQLGQADQPGQADQATQSWQQPGQDQQRGQSW